MSLSDFQPAPHQDLAPALRERIIRHAILPVVDAHFRRFTPLQSAVLYLAQYHNDEAEDAVHAGWLFSELTHPDLPAALAAEKRAVHADEDINQQWIDTINFPCLQTSNTFYNTPCLNDTPEVQTCFESPSELQQWSQWIQYWFYLWPENDLAIPAFAAFCREGCSNADDFEIAYRPYLLFQKETTDSIKQTLIGKNRRPWLEGVHSDWLGQDIAATHAELQNMIANDNLPLFGKKPDQAFVASLNPEAP